MRVSDLQPFMHLPRRTIRLRLTLLYASLFLVSGAVLLGVTYVLVRQATGGALVTGRSSVVFFGSRIGSGAGPVSGTSKTVPAPGRTGLQTIQITSASGQVISGRLTPQEVRVQSQRLESLAAHQHNAEMHQLVEKSGIALAIMAALSMVLGWLAAGRVLRPLRTVTARAQEISARNLHRRLALAGPDDELKQLADTFDDLLGRLETSFVAQRQFVANASHELRTPLARAQTVAEVALSDPDATVESLRASHERVLAAGEQQERLIEALLTLARSERGLERREPFDLAAITRAVLAARGTEAEALGLDVRATFAPAGGSGDARLAERLVANLVDNAMRHNREHGRIDIETTTKAGNAVMSVSNTGPAVPAGDVERLFQPFQRLGAERTGDGLGLGLSIVHAIAVAHGATLNAEARPDGGLAIEVGFPHEARGEPVVAEERPGTVSALLVALRRKRSAPV